MPDHVLGLFGAEPQQVGFAYIRALLQAVTACPINISHGATSTAPNHSRRLSDLGYSKRSSILLIAAIAVAPTTASLAYRRRLRESVLFPFRPRTSIANALSPVLSDSE